MRASALAFLLAAPAHALRVGDDLAVHEIFERLKDSVRSVKAESRLETAPKLSVPPPFGGTVKLVLRSNMDRFDYDCEEKAAKPGCGTVYSMMCSWDEDESSTGVVAASSVLWQRALGPDGVVDEDRLAVVLGHEIGHLMLKHVWQGVIKYEDLYDLWYRTKGRRLEEHQRARESTRYTRDARGRLSDADVIEINHDVMEIVGREKERDSEEMFMEYSRRMESEADEYGIALAKAAGFNPKSGAGIYAKAEYDRFMKFVGSCPIQPKKFVLYNPNSSHPDFVERDSRLFEEYYLRGR